MTIEDLISYYATGNASKIFLTKLDGKKGNVYIMYLHNYASELEDFAETFLKYLPFYVRNSDQLVTIDEKGDVDEQLIIRSKRMRKDSRIIPHRTIGTDGIYGELFLDLYLRIIRNRKAVITYASRRPYASNYESTGPDNIVYYIDEAGQMNICLCEAKFVEGAARSKNALVKDIKGETGIPGHVSANYINSYFEFIVEKGDSIPQIDRDKFKSFFRDLNAELDNGNDFLSVLIKYNICVNFVFFAVFDSTKRMPVDLEVHYDEIYDACQEQIRDMSITNYRIEIVFIPTDNSTMKLKEEMEKSYA